MSTECLKNLEPELSVSYNVDKMKMSAFSFGELLELE